MRALTLGRAPPSLSLFLPEQHTHTKKKKQMLSEESSCAAKAAAAQAAADDFALDDDLLADDEELRRLHADRADELRRESEARAAALRAQASGHGTLTRFAREADFLEAAAASGRLVAHFAHGDFESCKLVDAHLERLAPRWLGTRFVRIEASDAPFFVTRLKVRVLPAVLCFVGGACSGRVVGFDELGGSSDFSTRALERALRARNVLVERFAPSGGGGGNGGATGTREAGGGEEENRRPEDEDGCDGENGKGAGRRGVTPPEHSRRNVRAGGGGASSSSRRRRGRGGDSEDESGTDDSRTDSETESI